MSQMVKVNKRDRKEYQVIYQRLTQLKTLKWLHFNCKKHGNRKLIVNKIFMLWNMQGYLIIASNSFSHTRWPKFKTKSKQTLCNQFSGRLPPNDCLMYNLGIKIYTKSPSTHLPPILKIGLLVLNVITLTNELIR